MYHLLLSKSLLWQSNNFSFLFVHDYSWPRTMDLFGTELKYLQHGLTLWYQKLPHANHLIKCCPRNWPRRIHNYGTTARQSHFKGHTVIIGALYNYQKSQLTFFYQFQFSFWKLCLSSIMPNDHYAKHPLCQTSIMPIVFMPIVLMPNVLMPNVFMPNVVHPYNCVHANSYCLRSSMGRNLLNLG